NTIAGEDVLEHLAIVFNVTNDHRNSVGTFTGYQQIRNVSTDPFDFLIASGRFNDPQRIIGRKRLAGFEIEEPLQHRPARTGGTAKFGERLFGKGLVLNESLPSPLGKLGGFDVRGCVEEHDRPALRQALDKRSHQVKLGFRQIVESVENHTAELLEPRRRPFHNSACGEQPAILKVNNSAPAKPVVELL